MAAPTFPSFHHGTPTALVGAPTLCASSERLPVSWSPFIFIFLVISKTNQKRAKNLSGKLMLLFFTSIHFICLQRVSHSKLIYFKNIFGFRIRLRIPIILNRKKITGQFVKFLLVHNVSNASLTVIKVCSFFLTLDKEIRWEQSLLESYDRLWSISMALKMINKRISTDSHQSIWSFK